MTGYSKKNIENYPIEETRISANRHSNNWARLFFKVVDLDVEESRRSLSTKSTFDVQILAYLTSWDIETPERPLYPHLIKTIGWFGGDVAGPFAENSGSGMQS